MLITRKIKKTLFKITFLKKLGLIKIISPYADIINKNIQFPNSKVDSIDKKIVFIIYKKIPYFNKNLNILKTIQINLFNLFIKNDKIKTI